MVICNLNVMHAIRLESEADAPLVIDADTPLSRSFARKRLEAVGRWKPEVLNIYSGVNLGKSNDCPRLNIPRQFPDRNP